MNGEWCPKSNPWVIAMAVMLASFLEVLDTSVANVALPHIAGSLSVTAHEATWVLTSYLVSNAIILPATAWLGGFFGRKRFFMICIFIFTFSSFLCGIASNLGLLILARVLQGAGGGALLPISQAILLESFPKEKRGMAMGIFALGVVVAPILGPTIGGWITDNFSWRWIFYINLPLGILALLMTNAVIEDPPYLKKGSVETIDYVGFGLMALGLGLFQLVMDKGQEEDWFSTPWIFWASVISFLSLSAFILWELNTEHPVVNLKILKNRNFAIGCGVMSLIGAVLYGTTALLPLFLQDLMGYSAFLSGFAVSPRGVGAFMVSSVIGQISGKIDNRILIGAGLLLLAFSGFSLGNINLTIGISSVIWPMFLNGIAISLIFVPLTLLTVGSLNHEEMGNATGLFNLMRNVGGSIGIAAMSTMLSRFSQAHQAHLVSRLTPYDAAYPMRLAQTHVSAPLVNGMIYRELVRQSTLMSFVDNFKIMSLLCLACVPAVLLFKKVTAKKQIVTH